MQNVYRYSVMANDLRFIDRHVESAFKFRMNKVYTNIAFYVNLMLFINNNNINCFMYFRSFIS